MPARRPATVRHAARRRPVAKVDLQAAHKNDYVAPRTPTLIRMPRAKYLAIAGQGAPGSATFQDAIGALYGVAFTLKMKRKAAGRDFVVSKLEGQYWWPNPSGAMPATECQWQLLIRVPTFLTEREVKAAAAALIERGKGARATDVQLVSLDEGRCVQMLHVGPWDAEQDTVKAMMGFATGEGLTFTGRHHEIYLSDPRRVPAARLRTILRQPVA